MRDFLQWRRRDAIMLAEANVPPRESMHYFGEHGDRLQMMLNFWVNQRIFYALATGDAGAAAQGAARHLRAAARRAVGRASCARTTSSISAGSTKRQRERVFAAFAPEKRMQLYDRGIRRRLAPMLSNDRRRIELANSLLFTLPGTPVMRYGDEIGMGDDLDLPERYSVRTPMQWSPHRHGGFTTGRRADPAA